MNIKEKIVDCVMNCKSKNEFNLKYFGYCNKKTYDKFNSFIIKYNLDVSHWKKRDNFCIECGKKIYSNIKKFCNHSCSASYNNKKRVLSNETKNKISKSLLGNTNNVNISLKKCVVCKTHFKSKRTNSGRYSKSKCCSIECRKTHRSIVSKISMERIMREGNHKGWIKRNIVSYPEKFFIKVLNNNNIVFKHNYSINKRQELGVDEPYSYFLDFFIESKNINLEIDGKQHKYREEHDKIRDSLLAKNGIHVYRIKWKSINNNKGKIYIENEIKKFIEFYNSIV